MFGLSSPFPLLWLSWSMSLVNTFFLISFVFEVVYCLQQILDEGLRFLFYCWTIIGIIEFFRSNFLCFGFYFLDFIFSFIVFESSFSFLSLCLTWSMLLAHIFLFVCLQEVVCCLHKIIDEGWKQKTWVGGCHLELELVGLANYHNSSYFNQPLRYLGCI